ncbi:hypothetical protein GGTG_12012 [Gaeumannomyces tritici R3-111a-1]|uniref:Uncharacterized protein n=1 Tax=Gaeumannomyces tritici (strain R3-111a-1) TaxID=644352 RepID=J3PET3_GAET3|nr:hypothetical protein GGTG_12012 [Gaeumannomyces tritici R3-111a-1]EJT70991.1 hypothetical protein GGTG_12012 [Gaeumannomyces tritici R3-111a-1]
MFCSSIERLYVWTIPPRTDIHHQISANPYIYIISNPNQEPLLYQHHPRTMNTWLSVHIGAIVDSRCSFSNLIESTSALIKPASTTELEGWVQFVIPSPPLMNPVLRTLAVDFSTMGATVDGVRVLLGGAEGFSMRDMHAIQSFSHEIVSRTAIHKNKGIAVSVLAKFMNMSSSCRFQSVAIEV